MFGRYWVALAGAAALAFGSGASAAEPGTFARGSEPGVALFVSKPVGSSHGGPRLGLRLERLGNVAGAAGQTTFAARTVGELPLVRLARRGDMVLGLDGIEDAEEAEKMDSSSESSIRLRPWMWGAIGAGLLLLLDDDDDDPKEYVVPPLEPPR